jgi:UDP-N-acetylglucosamine acyltransferase
MARIHPSAIVDPGAELDGDVEVGPFSVIGAAVRLGAGTRVGAHVVIDGRTTLGKRNRVFPFASIGLASQDRKYGGEPVSTTIGDDNVIREYVSIHAGTAQDRADTAIGDGNWFLAYTHVAHDCVVGSHTTWSNNAQVAGHVRVGDWAVLGAYAGVHQFCRVGEHAMLAAGAIVLQDVPPYTIVQGYPAVPKGTNSEGLRRRGFTPAQILAIRRAYKTIYREGLSLDDARAKLAQEAAGEPVLAPLAAFLAVEGRGIVR